MVDYWPVHLNRLAIAISIVVCFLAGMVPAASGAPRQSRWWWTASYAEQVLALRWLGDAYVWNVGCAAYGPHRFYAKRVLAYGPNGASVGAGLRPQPAWKFQSFRCIGRSSGALGRLVLRNDALG